MQSQSKVKATSPTSVSSPSPVKSGFTSKTYVNRFRTEGGSRTLRTTFRNHSTGELEELSKKDLSTPSLDSSTAALLRPGEGPQKLSVVDQVARLTRYSRGIEEGMYKLNPNVFIPMESEELASKLPRPFPLVNKVFRPPRFTTQEEKKEKSTTIVAPSIDKSKKPVQTPKTAPQPVELDLVVPKTPVSSPASPPLVPQPVGLGEVGVERDTLRGDYMGSPRLRLRKSTESNTWTRVTTAIEEVKSRKFNPSLDIRPEADRWEGEHLVRKLQVAAHTLGHVVRRKVLNSNLKQILDSCAMLNWDLITGEAQDWAQWKRQQVEKRKIREWEEVVSNASHMFKSAEEEVEKEEQMKKAAKIAKVIRKESNKRDQVPVISHMEVDQIIDRNGNQLQSIMLVKEEEEVECELFSLVEYSHRVGKWFITTHMPLDVQRDILTITKEVKKQWRKFPWELSRLRMTISARNPDSRMFLVNMGGVVSSLRKTFKVVKEPRKSAACNCKRRVVIN